MTWTSTMRITIHNEFFFRSGILWNSLQLCPPKYSELFNKVGDPAVVMSWSPRIFMNLLAHWHLVGICPLLGWYHRKISWAWHWVFASLWLAQWCGCQVTPPTRVENRNLALFVDEVTGVRDIRYVKIQGMKKPTRNGSKSPGIGEFAARSRWNAGDMMTWSGKFTAPPKFKIDTSPRVKLYKKYPKNDGLGIYPLKNCYFGYLYYILLS